MTTEFVSLILALIIGLVALALVITDMEHAKRNNLPPRWVWSNRVTVQEEILN